MLLDVLLQIKAQQDPSLVVPFGCRRGRCGACASTVNGASLLPCTTPVNRAVTGVSLQAWTALASRLSQAMHSACERGGC